MNDKAREERNAYLRAWRKKNKDKVKNIMLLIGKIKFVKKKGSNKNE
ncbi:Uncharacterised protein [Clostridium perfringens]|nr:hypothetical protein [Clostridium perfringens]VTR84193.1 Uncharacterised protein [Clostridium perfringens]